MPHRDDRPSRRPEEHPHPELNNIQAVMDLERATRSERTPIDRITDAINALIASPLFIVIQVGLFVVWIWLNAPGRQGFDPYPFSLLGLGISLEALVLTGFVLMAQRRMTQQADRRAHLDLQINLLAEQELTAILRVVALLAERAQIDVNSCAPGLEALLRHTNVNALATQLSDELAQVDVEAPPGSPAAEHA